MQLEESEESFKLQQLDGIQGFTNKLPAESNCDELLFSIDESPPWHMTLLLAFQVESNDII